jgi:soluble lytic murein transglycosylase-like protein
MGRLRAGALIGCACLPLAAVAGGESESRHSFGDSASRALRLEDGASYQLAEEYQSMPGRDRTQAEPVLRREVSVELAGKPFSKEIEFAARRAALDPALVHAVIHVESRHRQQAVSPKGAIGLMQVMPATAARYGIPNPGRSPRVNLAAGTLYLRDLMQMFDNRLDLVLAAYNAGEGAVLRHASRIPPYRETQSYVRAVLAQYGEWRRAHDATDGSEAQPDARAIRVVVDYLPGTRLGFPAPAEAR